MSIAQAINDKFMIDGDCRFSKTFSHTPELIDIDIDIVMEKLVIPYCARQGVTAFKAFRADQYAKDGINYLKVSFS